MQRRTFIQHAGLAGILAAGAAPAVVHAQENLRWRMASSFPKSLETIFGGSLVFAQMVKDLTGGKFQISVHSPGELVPAFGVVDAVQEGTVECGHTCGYYYVGKDETFAIDTAIPFGMNARQTNAWMYRGNGMKLLREFFAAYNIVNFPLGNSGTQMGGWFRKEIKSMADMNGLKMRIGGFAGQILATLGAVPQTIPASDTYQALEKGTIDAVEWSGPYDDLKLGFHKVAPYYYYPGWWEGGPQLSLYINRKQWESLSPEYQAVVTAAASHASLDILSHYDAVNPVAMKQLIAEGAQLRRFPIDFMDAARKTTHARYEQLHESNAAWRKVYGDYSKFLAEQYQWWGVNEFAFDSYMVQQQQQR